MGGKAKNGQIKRRRSGSMENRGNYDTDSAIVRKIDNTGAVQRPCRETIKARARDAFPGVNSRADFTIQPSKVRYQISERASRHGAEYKRV